MVKQVDHSALAYIGAFIADIPTATKTQNQDYIKLILNYNISLESPFRSLCSC